MSRLHQFLNPFNFELAWDKVATNRGCAGVDRETIAQFGRQKQRKLARLLQQVVQGELGNRGWGMGVILVLGGARVGDCLL